MIKKIAKYILYFFLSIIVLLMTVSILLYIPFVQDKAVQIVSRTLSSKLDMNISVKQIRLTFPLDISVSDAQVIKANNDTMLRCDKLNVGVALLPLFRGNIDITRFGLSNALFHFSDSLSQFDIKGNIGEIKLKADHISLGKQKITVQYISLNKGSVHLFLDSSVPDTTQKKKNPLQWIFDVKRISLQEVDYSMEMRPNTMILSSHIAKAELKKGKIDMYKQLVNVSDLAIEKGSCHFFMAQNENTSGKSSDTITSRNDSTIPWDIHAGKISLSDFSGTYGTLYHQAAPGFDPQYISVSHLTIGIDSLYNSGSNISLLLRNFSLQERSGISIKEAAGKFTFDNKEMALEHFHLSTPQSQLYINGIVDRSVFEKNNNGTLQLAMNGVISLHDISPFIPSYNPFDFQIPATPLSLSTDMHGSLGNIILDNFTLVMPTYLSLAAKGQIKSLLYPDRMTGQAHWRMQMPNISFVNHFLGAEVRKQINIPNNIHFDGDLLFKSGNYTLSSLLSLPEGNIDLKGELNVPGKRYNAMVKASHFPIKEFLPRDSLGYATFTLQGKGSGYDFMNGKTVVDAQLDIDQFDYRLYNYAPLKIDVKTEKENISAIIKSESSAIVGNISIDGIINPQLYSAEIKGGISRFDLFKTHLSQDTLSIAADVDLKGKYAPKNKTFSIHSQIENMVLGIHNESYRFRPLMLHAENNEKECNASLDMGDLHMMFNSYVSLFPFLDKIIALQKDITQQIEKDEINVEKLSHDIPHFKFDISGGKENVLYHYLRSKGVLYTHFNFTAEALPETPFYFRSKISKLQNNGILLDTIQISGRQDSTRLYYELGIRNIAGNLPDVAYAQLSGYLENNTITASLLQKKNTGEVGFDFGCNALFNRNSIRLSFTPTQPILGYEKWQLNENNFFEFFYNKEMYANLHLENSEKGFHLESIDLLNENKGGLHINMKGIDLAPLLTITPLAPPISGILSSDLNLALPHNNIIAKGEVAIQQFAYNKETIGDISLDVNYETDSINTQMGKAKLMINNETAAILQAKYFTSGRNNLEASVIFPGIDLKTINPFIPEQTLLLSGKLKGNLNMTGELSQPVINGELQFDSGGLKIPMIGTSFTFGNNPILIEKNKISFNNYSISGPNKRPLNINGHISLEDFAHIYTDISLKATEFEPINVSKNRQSMVFGKAIMDIEATAKGRLDAMKIRGNVQLLNGTEVTYVMRESPLELKQESSNMVSFVSFNDTTQMINSLEATQVPTFGMDVLFNIDIANAVKMAVNLSADAKNRINVQGGGNLTYSMNALGDSRFMGRYELSGGTVNYSPPIISTKNFNIQPGSYVSWNGDVADPTLNITATESLKSSITDDSGNNRDVTFDVSINIRNTLENLAITFDISTPDDLSIQNQLASLTPEQRATQAMNVIIYNTYTGPGASGKSGNNIIGNPLNAFIQKELNQWARNNLKNIDVSFGINSSQDKFSWSPDNNTDYSYKVSKTLFNNRVKVIIGGSYSMDNDPTQNLKENLIDDISLEYMLDKRDNMFIKLFRQSNTESILEGEIIETGVGFVVKKKLNRLRELFQLSSRKRKSKKENNVQTHEK